MSISKKSSIWDEFVPKVEVPTKLKTKTITFVDIQDILLEDEIESFNECDLTFGDMVFGIISKDTFLHELEKLLDNDILKLNYPPSASEDEIDAFRDSFLDRIKASLVGIEWINIESKIDMSYNEE